jgi:hypothetical protein
MAVVAGLENVMNEIPKSWHYEIQYGPEGEDNYAWVYCGSEMIATMHTWHAREIVEAMNAHSQARTTPTA